MKKLLSVILLAALVLTSAWAGDFSFAIGDVKVHEDILAGFCPTFAEAGFNYDGLELKYGNQTRLSFMAGGGYIKNFLYQDETGAQIELGVKKPQEVNTWRIRYNLGFSQGFGNSDVLGYDLVTAYGGYKGVWERFMNFNGPEETYPDMVGDHAMTHSVYVGAKVNMMEDRMVTTDGFTTDLCLEYAPFFVNDKSSFFTVTSNTVFAKTIYELQQKNGKNLFSIVFIDRLNASYTQGDEVPLFAQHPVSLGRKVRGLDKGTYNTNLTVANNTDIRFSSPEPWIDGIFARFNLFLDEGYYAGRYLNSQPETERVTGFVLTTGAQIELCLFDFVDLGFQGSYIIKGASYKHPADRFVTEVFFTLDF